MSIRSDIEFLVLQPDCCLEISYDNNRWMAVFVRNHGPDLATSNFSVEEAYAYGDTLADALVGLRKKVDPNSKKKKKTKPTKRTAWPQGTRCTTVGNQKEEKSRTQGWVDVIRGLEMNDGPFEDNEEK